MASTREFNEDERRYDRSSQQRDRRSHPYSNRYSNEDASRYSRTSSRYAHARVEQQPQASPAPRQSASRGADRYSRDRYRSTPDQRRATSVSQQQYAAAQRVKPVRPAVLITLTVIAVVLAVFVTVRFIGFSATSGEYFSIQGSISEQQSELSKIDASNANLQSQMDSMQATID